MTKTEKQLFDAMIETMHQRYHKELDYLIAKRNSEEAREAYLAYMKEKENQEEKK